MTREGSCSIPFNRPSLSGRELSYIRDAIENGQISGDGLFTRRCQTVFQDLLRVPKALLTTSCTDALEMAGILTSVAVGDEVILPSFTFVSTATAFVLRGAKPVFSDIRPDTLNMDETQLETLVTPRAKVILPVHYAGVGCEMDAILALASRHGIAVIEDNAHGLFGKYKGRYLGTIGCLGAQSFHETKNIICGEGGALLINDASLVERAEIIRSKGTNRSQFLRGQVDKYTWVDVGSSFLPSDILAAFLYAQLEARAEIQAKRKAIWQRYRDALLRWAEQHGVGLPFVPDHCEQSYHMFYLIMPTGEQRDDLITHLRKRGILAVFHYVPLHSSPMGLRFGGRVGDCPVSEDISRRLVRLPFFTSMTEDEQEQVMEGVVSFEV